MNTLGSHPGAILFRLTLMVILIAILIMVFMSYLEDTERELERVSISQTKKIIDSSLAVVYSTYAVNHRLDELNDLEGGNPFEFCRSSESCRPDITVCSSPIRTRNSIPAGTTSSIAARLSTSLILSAPIFTTRCDWTTRT